MKLITTTTVQYLKGKEKVVVPPDNGEHDFPKEVGQDLLDRGHADLVEKAKPELTEAEKEAKTVKAQQAKDAKAAKALQNKIVKAIEALNKEDRELFADDGKPTVEAIESVLGSVISVEDRDTAWDTINAS